MSADPHFLDWVVQQGSRKLAQEALLAAYVRIHPDLVQSPSLRGHLLTALRALEAHGVIVLPKRSADWDRNADGVLTLPHYVRRLSPAAAAAVAAGGADREPVYWLPPLARAAEVVRKDTRRRLHVLNAYLIANPDALRQTIPYREMALDVFNDEKALDGCVREGKLFGLFPIESIGMCDPEPPLAREDFPFPGMPMLLVENHQTYWSLIRWNETAGQYASIVFGSGNMIRKSMQPILAAKKRSGASRIEYVGDLDPMGIIIAHGLDGKLRHACGEPVAPAEALYQYMLASPRKRRITDDKKQDPGPSLEWLPPVLREQTEALFGAGQWIPQEALRLKAPSVGQ